MLSFLSDSTCIRLCRNIVMAQMSQWNQASESLSCMPITDLKLQGSKLLWDGMDIKSFRLKLSQSLLQMVARLCKPCLRKVPATSQNTVCIATQSVQIVENASCWRVTYTQGNPHVFEELIAVSKLPHCTVVLRIIMHGIQCLAGSQLKASQCRPPKKS